MSLPAQDWGGVTERWQKTGYYDINCLPCIGEVLISAEFKAEYDNCDYLGQ